MQATAFHLPRQQDTSDSISNEIGVEPWFQIDDICLECGRAIIKGQQPLRVH